jgi:flavin-binding protein dodecin
VFLSWQWDEIKTQIESNPLRGGIIMSESVYKVIELIGTSETSWEEAAKVALERANKTLKDLRVAEVTSQDVKIEDGKVTAFRTKLAVSFKYLD